MSSSLFTVTNIGAKNLYAMLKCLILWIIENVLFIFAKTLLYSRQIAKF